MGEIMARSLNLANGSASYKVAHGLEPVETFKGKMVQFAEEPYKKFKPQRIPFMKAVDVDKTGVGQWQFFCNEAMDWTNFRPDLSEWIETLFQGGKTMAMIHDGKKHCEYECQYKVDFNYSTEPRPHPWDSTRTEFIKVMRPQRTDIKNGGNVPVRRIKASEI